MALLLGASTAAAQEGAVETADTELASEQSAVFADAPVFLPRSYLYWGSPVGSEQAPESLYFALQYAFHLPVYNDLRAKARSGGAWAGAANLSFAGALRMLTDESAPIRMPSYRPSVSGQAFRIFHGAVPVLLGLTLELSHHSNGQEGCIFDEEARDRTEACRRAIAAVEDPALALNRTSGNFSNNSLIQRIDVRAHAVDARGVARSHLAVGLFWGVHLPAGAAGLGQDLRRLYGGGRLGTHVEAQHVVGTVELRAEGLLRHFFGTGPTVPSTMGSLTLAAEPNRLVGFGFFVRYHGGRDFYNAFFVDRIQQFSAGVCWDAERPLRFAMP